MHKHPKTYVTLAILAVSVAAIGGFLRATNPESLGPVGIAAFFLAVYVALVATGSLFGFALDYIRGSQHSMIFRITTSMALALPLVMLLALNTIRDVSLIDALLALVFGAVLLFYIRRR